MKLMRCMAPGKYCANIYVADCDECQYWREDDGLPRWAREEKEADPSAEKTGETNR